MRLLEFERKFLSIPEMARESGMSKGFWSKMIWKKRIRYAKVGRSVRVSREDFDAYLADRRVQPASEIAA
jgi:excisionase family DNA binding protein